jgi:hypothetical protein
MPGRVVARDASVATDPLEIKELVRLRDQIGFVADPMKPRAAAQDVAPINSDADPYRVIRD